MFQFPKKSAPKTKPDATPEVQPASEPGSVMARMVFKGSENARTVGRQAKKSSHVAKVDDELLEEPRNFIADPVMSALRRPPICLMSLKSGQAR